MGMDFSNQIFKDLWHGIENQNAILWWSISLYSGANVEINTITLYSSRKTLDNVPDSLAMPLLLENNMESIGNGKRLGSALKEKCLSMGSF